MAERLEVSKSWLSRYLELARLPAELIAAFGSPHIIGISHGAVLAPLLRMPLRRERMLEAAAALAVEQSARADRAAPLLPPPLVLRRLTEAAKGSARPARGPAECVIRDSDGTVVARGQRAARGSVALTVPALAKQDVATVLQAVTAIINHFKAAGR
jgi:ParB family chromosome partitioning protein